jgi:hypothetical protein
VPLVLAAALLAAAPALTQVPAQRPSGRESLPPPRVTPKVTPRLEPVAETKLLMEGLNLANFRGLERLLRQRPDSVEAWKFARGQALLIAETGNLLMLRPPRSQGQPLWFARAAELRGAARDLAQNAGARDYEASRAALVSVANACNHCHQSFRVKVEIAPFADPSGEKE